MGLSCLGTSLWGIARTRTLWECYWVSPRALYSCTFSVYQSFHPLEDGIRSPCSSAVAARNFNNYNPIVSRRPMVKHSSELKAQKSTMPKKLDDEKERALDVDNGSEVDA